MTKMSRNKGSRNENVIEMVNKNKACSLKRLKKEKGKAV